MLNTQELFTEIFKLILESKVCPGSTPSEWIKTLSYMHKQGYLYVAFEDDKLAVVAGAYRIKEGQNFDEIPEKEEGDILYVPFLVSRAKSKNLAYKILGEYIHKNNITRIQFFERNSDENFREFKITRRKENVKTKDPIPTASANV